MSNGPTYSVDDYNVPGATGTGGILSNYQQEIADSQKDLESMVVAAKQQVLAKQQRDNDAAKAVYGTTLGEMYNGDREAVQVYRDYIYNNYQSGAYTNNPVQYQKDVAQLNNLITSFTNFYTETYGTNAADGTGTTYRDMVYNQTQGIENPFEAQGMKYDPNIDPFDQAQKTLAFRQMGGYAPNSVRVNEDGVLVARSLTYKDNGRHVVGPEVPITEMQDRQAGNQTFMPALVEDTTTIFDYIKNNKQDIQIMQSRTNFTVEESSAEYFDNEILNNTKFQRDMIKANASANITNEDIKAYQEGTLEGNKKILIEDAINKSKQQFIKSATFGTQEIINGGSGLGGGTRSDGEAMFTGQAQDFSLTGPGINIDLDVEGRNVDPDAVTYGGEDPIGTGEGELVDYMGLSRNITPIEMTGGQYGDYEIIAIAAGDNGDRYAIIEEVEFVLKDAAGEYKVVPPGTPGAQKGGTIRKRINLTTPDAINDAGDVDPRIDDINRALLEYNGAYDQLVVESQNRLQQRNQILAQERAEAERLRIEQERADAEFEAADDPEIEAGEVDEDAIRNVEALQDALNQPPDDAPLEAATNQFEDIEYQDVGIFYPIVGAASAYKTATNKAHAENYRKFSTEILKELHPDMTQEDIDKVLNSQAFRDALDEVNFSPNVVGGAGLQSAADFIGAGAYGAKRERLREAIELLPDKLGETAQFLNMGQPGVDPLTGSYTTMEEILDDPTKVNQPNPELEQLQEEEDVAYWSDVREKAGDSFWGSQYADDTNLFVNNGINTITTNEELAKAIEEFGNPPSGSPYRTIAESAGLLKNSFKAPTSDENVDVNDSQASLISYLIEKGNMSESAALALASVTAKESGGDFAITEKSYVNTSNIPKRDKEVVDEKTGKKKIIKVNVFSSLKGITEAEWDRQRAKGNPSFDNWFWETVYGKDSTKGKVLGNDKEGDGQKFRGRGLIQLTGKANYAAASEAIFGDDRLVKNPDLLLEDADVAGQVAGWFILKSKAFKTLAKSEDIDILETSFNSNDTQDILDTAYAAVAGVADSTTVNERNLYPAAMSKMQDFVLLTEEEPGTEE
tara:strand:- start:5376 stop:8612 length:3237 start_codon:yes stop_codon:yes gene_type:complete